MKEKIKRKDTYQAWKSEGQLESRLKLIKDLASKSSGMEVIASVLGISENTLYNLRKKYNDVEMAYLEGRSMLKKSLLEKMYERAMGFVITDEDTFIEQTATGTKNRVVKHTRNILPDMGVCRYLLIINFGKEYSEKKYELEISERKAEIKNNENEWKPLEIGEENANKNNKD